MKILKKIKDKIVSVSNNLQPNRLPEINEVFEKVEKKFYWSSEEMPIRKVYQIRNVGISTYEYEVEFANGKKGSFLSSMVSFVIERKIREGKYKVRKGDNKVLIDDREIHLIYDAGVDD